MAIEPMKKIMVIARKDLKDEVVDSLTRMSTVHIERISDQDFLEPHILTEEETEAARHYTYRLSQIEFLLNLFRQHATEKPGFLEGMIKRKYPMTVDEFMLTAERVDIGRIYTECSELNKQLLRLHERKARFEQDLEELLYWPELDIALEDLTDPYMDLRTVRISINDFEAAAADLEAEAPQSVLFKGGKRNTWVSCVILCHPDDEGLVGAVLSRYRYEDVVLPKIPDEPEERVDQIRRELTALERRIGKVVDGIQTRSDSIPDLEVLREFMSNRLRNSEVASSFGVTRSAVAIEGWVTARAAGRTFKRLDAVSDDIVVEIADPLEGDDPPVSQSNPKWVKPFELLIDLFGRPRRGEYDPTIIVAISFMIFFGFCIGDVGYGFVLIPALLLMRKYLPLGPKAKDLLVVLVYGSAWAIVIGIFSGAWFGIDVKSLPGALRSVAVLDGLNKTVLAMCVAIGVGVIHLLIGFGIEFHDNWKDGNKADALIDQGLIFLLFVGGGIGITLSTLKLAPTVVPLLIACPAVLGMLFLFGRSAPSIGGKIANGIFETYGTIVGFVSDAISYVRLFALGLATVVIAMVVNTMAGMLMGVAPVIGILLMVVVLVVGHTFNVAINLLGAFVHPLRLQYVEFFGKFYDDGGRRFKPLGVESKIVIIEEQEGA